MRCHTARLAHPQSVYGVGWHHTQETGKLSSDKQLLLRDYSLLTISGFGFLFCDSSGQAELVLMINGLVGLLGMGMCGRVRWKV